MDEWMDGWMDDGPWDGANYTHGFITCKELLKSF
jgi:hypothetical protein